MGLLWVISAIVDPRHVMQVGPCRILAAILVLGSAIPVCTQSSGNRATAPCNVLQPYTAEFKITHMERLADGTTITRVTKEVDARDSQRRTLRETTSTVPWQGRPAGTEGIVRNPDGGWTDWLSWYRNASTLKMPPPEQRHGCWASAMGSEMRNYDRVQPSRPAAAMPRPASAPPVIENLGTTVIDGVEAYGTRRTTTIPTGQIGNDEPLVTTAETWLSRRLALVLRSVTDDPQEGTTTRELVNLTLGEPDPTLFQPPAGYTIMTQELHQVPCQDQAK